jgi:predicted molibdopterin-dependent oxidoreductase YjgC
MAHWLTTCTFCGVGCGLYLETRGQSVVGAYPSVSHPSNAGRICVRGWHVHEVASSPDRLRTPLLRKHGELVPVTWSEALAFVVERLRAILDNYGPDAIAFLSSPRCSNEEIYLLQKLARAVIGTNNVDHGAGVYSHNSIEVLLKMIGVPAATNSIGALDSCEVILVDGIDLARQLPTIGGRVIRAKQNGAKLIVIGERRHHGLAELADHVLQLKPGTEALLYGAMAKVIVDRGLVDHAFVKERCRLYPEFLARVGDYDLLAAAEECGLDPGLIEAAALCYGRARSASLLYSTADATRGEDAVRAAVNLTLVTGNLSREKGGLYPLTEHNNLQGVCDMGLIPGRLPGYRRVADPEARKEVECLWETPLPSRPGLSAGSVLENRGGGRVRAVWLCRYDPVSTALVGAAFDSLHQCDLVVMQHIFPTETERFADVVLPTAAFGEEKVTFTSTDRRIQLAERAIDPPPGIATAWQQIVEVARGLGARWSYGSSAEIMDEIAEVVPFYAGANYENLERDYGRPWPCTRDRPLGTPRLFAGHSAEPTFSFAPLGLQPQQAATDEEYPLTLVFGHSNYYWNQSVLIQHSETLRREYRILLLDYPGGFVDLNTDDAKKFSVRDGEMIRLCAKGGNAVTAARVTPDVRQGAVFVPFFVRQVQQQIRGSTEGPALIPVRVERITS